MPSAAAADAPPPRGSSNDALSSLQAMVNLVLTHTGRYIKEANGGPGAGRAQYLMKQSVPAALGRFHESLDDLENELHQAQAALRRDLAVLQADRRKREQAEAAERRRLAMESSAKKSLSSKKDDTDAIIADVETQATSVPSGNPSAKLNSDNESLITSVPHQPSALNSTNAAPPSNIFDAAPTSANHRDSEFDLDSIFADHDFSHVPQTSAEEKDTNANSNMGSELPNLTYGLDGDNSGSSLLQGLEDFANSTHESAPNHAPNTAPNASLSDSLGNTKLSTIQPPNQTAPAPQTELIYTESSGHDQPQPTGEMQSSDQANLLDTVPDSSIDDLFNLGYDEAPEGTEFEDAFFFT